MAFHLSRRLFSTAVHNLNPTINFVTRDGSKLISVKAALGETLLDTARKHKLDLEGTCDHSLACCTCHIVLEEKDKKLFPNPDDNELDMLEVTPNLHETSRLACQLRVSTNCDGMTVQLG